METRIIAITFALPEESQDLVARLQDKRTATDGVLPVITGELNGRRVSICHTGVGADSCRARIASFLADCAPVALVSSGFAGGLDPALKVGDVILSKNLSDTALLPEGAIPGAIPSTMTTQPEVAESVEGKAALFSRTGASAVDMETGIIREHCTRCGIPMLSLRGISDAAGDNLPVSFAIWFDPVKQKPRVGALLWELATHPGKIPAFAKFVRGISFTRQRLTTALVAAIEKL